MKKSEVKKYFSTLGKKKSPAKAAASKANGAKGGRKPKTKIKRNSEYGEFGASYTETPVKQASETEFI